MNFVRYHKKCESWMACGAKGDKGAINFDYAHERKTIYQYATKGLVKISKLFSSESKIFGSGILIDVKEFYNHNVVYEFLEDTDVWGFNPTNEDDWDGKIVNQTFKSSGTSILVCLDGNPIVNNITLSRYDYDELTAGKIYNIIPDNGVLALFTKI